MAAKHESQHPTTSAGRADTAACSAGGGDAPERFAFARYYWRKERFEYHVVVSRSDGGWKTICGMEEEESQVPSPWVRLDNSGCTSCSRCARLASERSLPITVSFSPISPEPYTVPAEIEQHFGAGMRAAIAATFRECSIEALENPESIR
jgi:hypothetical protein